METQNEIRNAILAALRSGTPIRALAVSGLIEDLDRLSERIDSIVSAGDATGAADLYRTFITACEAKAKEVKDSSGAFRAFIRTLYCGWVRARDAADVPSQEIVSDLIRCMEEDRHGFCARLEDTVVSAMSLPALQIFERETRERLRATPPDTGGAAGMPRRRWTAVLKKILWRLGDAPALVELCESSGGLDAADCAAVGAILDGLGHRVESLDWIDRAQAELKRGRGDAEFADLLRKRKRNLLLRMGRHEEAERVLPRPKTRGLPAVPDRPQPNKFDDSIIAVMIAEALRILYRGESRKYSHALLFLSMARDSFFRTGRVEEWKRVVEAIRTDHGKKRAFIAKFERIVAGAPTPDMRPRPDGAPEEPWPWDVEPGKDPGEDPGAGPAGRPTSP